MENRKWMKMRRFRTVLTGFVAIVGATALVTVINSCGGVESACAQDCAAGQPGATGPAGPPGATGPAGPQGDSFFTEPSAGVLAYDGELVKLGLTNADGVKISSPDGNYLLLGAVGGPNETGYVRVAGYNSAEGTGKNLILQDSGGNVGIGTTTPTTRLDVAGDARVSGSLHVGAVFIESPDCTSPPPDFVLTDCTCPTGTMVLSGGAATNLAYLRESRPISATTWRVACQTVSGQNVQCLGPFTLICARLGT